MNYIFRKTINEDLVSIWLKEFMEESNDIEKENKIYKNHIEAAELSISEAFKPDLNSVRHLHKILGRRIHAEWVGKFRTCELTFPEGCPRWEVVSSMLNELLRNFDKMPAFEFYIRFEHIHPFCDLNGRVGRLLWLRRTIQEGEFPIHQIFELGFLKTFHYQALEFLKQNPHGLKKIT